MLGGMVTTRVVAAGAAGAAGAGKRDVCGREIAGEKTAGCGRADATGAPSATMAASPANKEVVG